MATAYSSPAFTSRKVIPPVGCGQEEILAYRDRIINHESLYRKITMHRAVRNLWMYKGRQDIDVDRRLLPSTGGYHFVRVGRKRLGDNVPMFANMLAPATDNEIARLGRRIYEPDTYVPRGGDASRETAARAARYYLQNRLERIAWASKREELYSHVTITGTAIAKAYWDLDLKNLDLVASPDAAICPACNLMLASQTVPEEMTPLVMRHAETIQASEEPGQAVVTHCPMCEEPNPLQPFKPSVQEAQGYSDFFDRPLGMTVPSGQTALDVVPMWELYPENGGLGVEPHNCRVWAQRSIRSLDWIADRPWGREYIDRIQPEEPRELLKYHPIVGESGMSGRFSPENDKGIFDNHALVDEIYVQPDGDNELGRAIICVKDEVCFDDVLMLEYEAPDGEIHKVPRVVYAAGRYKRVPGEFWGWTPFNDGVPLQRQLNELDAQDQDLREKGMPWFALPPDAQVKFRDDVRLGVYEFAEIDGPQGWTPAQSLVNAQPGTGNAYARKREQLLLDIRTVFGPQAVEQGDITQVKVKTTSGLMLATEEAGQKRSSVEREMTEMFTPLFQQISDLTWALKTDEDEYEMETAEGRREFRIYRSQDFPSRVLIKVTKRAGTDNKVYLSEATSEAIDKQLVHPDDGVVTDQLLELMQLPKELNAHRSVQITRANDAWDQFRKDYSIPTVDPTIDNPMLWNQVLNKAWQSQDALEMQRSVGWAKIVRLIGDKWEMKLEQAEAQDIAQRAAYESLPPEQWGAKYEQLGVAYQQAQMTASQAGAMAQPGAPPAPPIPEPPLPPDPMVGFLPSAMQDRIYQLLEQLTGVPPFSEDVDPRALTPEDQVPFLQCRLLQFYSVIQTYARLEKMKLREAQMMQAQAQNPAPPMGAAA